MSTFLKKCKHIDSIDNQTKGQLNIIFDADDPDKLNGTAERILFSIYTSQRASLLYGEHESYFISFQSKRTLNSFIRIKNEEIRKFTQGLSTLEEVASRVLKSGDLMLWDASEEEQNSIASKFSYYDPIYLEDFEIRDIKDTSTEELKRFIANIFAPLATRPNHIRVVVEKAIYELKKKQNYGNPKYKLRTEIWRPIVFILMCIATIRERV